MTVPGSRTGSSVEATEDDEPVEGHRLGLRPLIFGIGWDRPGGLNRYVLGLRAALEDAGVHTRTLVLGPATDAPATVLVMGTDEAPLLSRLWRYARAARREAAPDTVVDVHFALFAWWPVRWGSLRAAPLVVHFHGPWSEESLATGERAHLGVWAKRCLERSLYCRAQHLVVLSEAFKQLLVDDYDVAPWRVSVIRPGVELGRFTPDRVSARARVGHHDGQDVVFTVRRLVPRMGLDVLLRAWACMPAGGRDRRLLIAGEGPAREALERQIEELDLTGVRLLGRVSEDDLVEHYRAADLCVLPSVALEGFGLAALESLACGTPVVVTAVGGLPDVVRELDAGLVVEPGRPQALAARLAEGLAGRVPSSASCRAHAETFSWTRAAAANYAVYEQARAERARAPRDVARLRIVYLDHCAQLSGAEIALSRLLQALPEVDAHVVLAEDGPLVEELRRHQVSVQVRRMSPAAKDLRRGDVRPGRLPWRSALEAVRYTLSLAWQLRRMQPDAIHTNSLKSALYGSVAGRLAGVPVVWHARDRVSEDYLPTPAARLVRAVVRRLPAVVLANSQSTLDSLRLPPGSRVRSVVVADPYRSSAPTDVNREPRAGLTVGMVGRLAPWKGQHVFLAAFARARPTGTARAVLFGSAMFGEESYEAALRRQVHELGLSDRVTFAGFRPDIAAELCGLDVLVHASITPEPFGQVLVEGMAAGLPVVASGAGGPTEIVRDGVDGLLYPPGDVQALADVLDRLLDDDALRRRLGANARISAERFSPEVIAPSVMSSYRALLR